MQNQKTGVIYRIYHKETLKSYIGQTINFRIRINEHFSNRNKCPKLAKAIKKHKKEQFTVEKLESDVPSNLLKKLECLHIRFWNSVENGYNLTYGGEGGIPSEETRKALSAGQRRRFQDPEERERNKKRTKDSWTKEGKQKAREKVTKRFENPEERRKQSERIKKFHEENPEVAKEIGRKKTGTKFTIESRNKQSKSQKKAWQNPETREKRLKKRGKRAHKSSNLQLYLFK